jgi:branched-chain amino acid transport system ATP-binding protein
VSERTPALVVEDVTVRFGGHLALDRVGMQADAGRVTGLIGPNGAGKTTLFNVVTGLLTPQQGRVLVAGRDVTRLAPYRRARRGLARTFQRLELFGLLTVRENVELAASVGGGRRGARHAAGGRRRVRDADAAGGRRRVRDADAALDLAGLRDVAGVRADELPTGTARRVELARALATGPRVLLLDEPASGQDEAETEEFRRVLPTVAGEGLAVVLVEHDVRLVMGTCDTVHVLDFGRVLASGTPREIQANRAVLDAYLGTAP